MGAIAGTDRGRVTSAGVTSYIMRAIRECRIDRFDRGRGVLTVSAADGRSTENSALFAGCRSADREFGLAKRSYITGFHLTVPNIRFLCSFGNDIYIILEKYHTNYKKNVEFLISTKSSYYFCNAAQNL